VPLPPHHAGLITGLLLSTRYPMSPAARRLPPSSIRLPFTMPSLVPRMQVCPGKTKMPRFCDVIRRSRPSWRFTPAVHAGTSQLPRMPPIFAARRPPAQVVRPTPLAPCGANPLSPAFSSAFACATPSFDFIISFAPAPFIFSFSSDFHY